MRPVFYGDMRVTTSRDKGSCLFWVVPDVTPGFNTPPFYDEFVKERREHVAELVARKKRQRADAENDASVRLQARSTQECT